MKHNLFAAIGMVVLAGAGAGFGQAPGAINQVDSVQQRRWLEQASHFEAGTNAPELYSGESSDVGPQSVLLLKPRRTWFQAAVDAQYFYTDNALLSKNNRVSTGVLVSTAEVALAPNLPDTATGRWAPRAGYRVQWYDFGLEGKPLLGLPFGELSDLDFNAHTAFAELGWYHHNWLLQAGFDYTRLLTTGEYHEYYHEAVPRLTAQRMFPVNDRVAILLGYEGDYRWSSADVGWLGLAQHLDERTDHGVIAACTVALCEHAVVQPYYRFKYTRFSHLNEVDYLHSAGLALYWIVCPRFTVRGFVGYENRDSNLPGAEYHKLDAGGGLNLNFRF